jgi:translocation and assembly module TamB
VSAPSPLARPTRWLGWLGWAVLGALAAAGVALSLLTAYWAFFPTGPVLTALVTRAVESRIAGRLAFEGIVPLSRGAVEVRGLALRDPDGHLVLTAARARVWMDATGLARGRLGLAVEVDSLAVQVDTEPDGELSIARAFASPGPARAPPGAPPARGTGLRIRFTRLAARGATVRWLRADGSAALAAGGLDLDARGELTLPASSGRPLAALLEARLRGTAEAPVPGPLELAVTASLHGDRLVVPAFEGTLGGTSLRALGELDVQTGAFRAAVARLGLAAEDARRLVPARAAPAADVSATAYGESDGRTIDAAAEVAPSEGGTARAGVAFRPARRALGLDLALAGLDPSRLVAQAPAGRVDLTLHGAAEGRDLLADGRARLTLALARSRLRGTELGPIALAARADRGVVDVERLDARLPGVAVTGRGTWRVRGAVEGEVQVDAPDAAAARRAVAALSGVSLPAVSGRLRARGTLAGTSAAPALAGHLDAPLLGAVGALVHDLSLDVEVAGPVAAGRLRLAGRAARVEAEGTEARGVLLSAAVGGDEASLSLTGSLPSVGPDPIAVEGRARLAEGRRRAEVRALTIRWPGARYALVAPATVTVSPLAVDRLELADGPRTLAISGGAGRRGAIDLRVEIVRLDLATLPRGLLAPEGLRGELTLDARATGTVGAPSVTAEVAVVKGGLGEATGSLRGQLAFDGSHTTPIVDLRLVVEEVALGDVRPLSASAALRYEGGSLHATASSTLADAPLLSVDARLPLALEALRRDPAAALGALRHAPLAATLALARLDLARVAGKAGLPPGLAGTLSGAATLAGTASTPRGRATVSLADGVVAGYRDVSGSADVALEDARVSITLRASIAGAEAVRGLGSLGAPLERLADATAVRAAPLALDLTVPAISLARAPGLTLPLEGTITAHLVAKGTLARPEGRLDVDGRRLALEGRAIGDLTAVVRQEGRTARAELSLRSAAGGALRAEGTLEAPRGPLEPDPLRGATAAARVTSEQLDLGFLPALLPGIVRTAGGRLTVDLRASGPVAGLRAEGTVALEKGRLDVVEVGDWSGLELALRLTGDTLEISRLEAHRRGGRLSGRLLARDLWSATRRFEGRVELAQLPISYAGAEVATIDAPVDLQGTLSRSLLDAQVTVESGTVRLPRRASGSLQEVGERPDIVEADLVAERARRARAGAAGAGGAGERPFEARCHVVAKKLVVRAERPALNVELRTDSTWRVAGGAVEARGELETARGTVEPISARVFLLERARVTFPGGPISTGALDVVARYDNPVAVVTVTVTGTIAKPALQFASQPPLDDAKIAMLIATGRTEMNLNTNSVAPLTAQEAGQAMVGAAVSTVFTGLVSDRLPVDQISFDTTRLYAGKYVTEALFVGYAYRFDAKAEEGENVNEVRAEYRLARRWRFELRYGDANVGDASIVWTTDY